MSAPRHARAGAVVSLDRAACTGCGRCVRACPGRVFAQTGGGPPEIDPEAQCIACGHCLALCPADAVVHSLAALEPAEADPAPAPTAEQVLGFLRSRRSVRQFRNETIDRDLLTRVLEAAAWAPSAKNLQATELIVVEDPGLLHALSGATAEYLRGVCRQLSSPMRRALLRRVAGPLVDGVTPMLPAFAKLVAEWDAGRDAVLFGAPCLVVFAADPSTTLAVESAQLALHTIALAAHAHGLAGFYAGYLYSAAARDRGIASLLGLGDRRRIVGALALGWPACDFLGVPARPRPAVTWL